MMKWRHPAEGHSTAREEMKKYGSIFLSGLQGGFFGCVITLKRFVIYIADMSSLLISSFTRLTKSHDS